MKDEESFITPKPNFPFINGKRIDFVLAFDRSKNDQKITAKSRDNSFQSFEETRETFISNLKSEYNIEVTEKESSAFKEVSFYLLHVPFETLETYANILQINKAIDKDYINLVNHLITNKSKSTHSNFSCHDFTLDDDYNIDDSQKLVPEFNRITVSGKSDTSITNAKKDNDRDIQNLHDINRTMNPDFIDDIQTRHKLHQPGWFEIIKDRFKIKDSFLHDGAPSFTAIYNKNNQAMFAGIYDSMGKVRKDLFFSPSERSKVMSYILCECHYMKCYDNTTIEFGIERLMGTNSVGQVFTSSYPLHDCSLENNITYNKKHARKELITNWASYKSMFTYQPLDSIRTYFGEKIGLYFAWLGFYNTALAYASLFGLFPVLWGIISMNSSQIIKDYCQSNHTMNIIMCPQCDEPTCAVWKLSQSCLATKISHIFDNGWSLAYAVIMSLWAALFLEFWKRRQFQLAYQWDLTDVEEDGEPMRPQYRAKANQTSLIRKNPVTMIDEKSVPMEAKMKAKFISAVTMIFGICVIIAAVVATVIYRLVLIGTMSTWESFKVEKDKKPLLSPSLLASITSSIISVTVIIILNLFYNKIAAKLTDWEWHRTVSKYENALTYKMFWFQFVNYYSPLFYIAFFKETLSGSPGNYSYVSSYRWQGCETGRCTYELAIQMFIILFVKQIALNFVEVLIPKIKLYFNKKNCEKTNNLERWEEDYLLEPTEDLTLFYEYLEMVIQYGFVTLFVTAFPLAPLFALFNNLVEIRLDAIKFLRDRQRAVAHKTLNIGSWESLLAMIGRVSVITNAFIIALTSDTIPKMIYSWSNENDSGYVENSISMYDTNCFQKPYILTVDNTTATQCGFYGHKVKVPNTNCKYQNTDTHWQILCTKFIFILIMEHVVFLVCWLIDSLIPDRSKTLESEIKREKHLTRIIIRNYEIMQKHSLASKISLESVGFKRGSKTRSTIR